MHIHAHDIRAAMLVRSITQEQWDDMRRRAGAAGLQLDEMNQEQRRIVLAIVLERPATKRGNGNAE